MITIELTRASFNVKKTYLAITVGNPGRRVVIDKPIGRHPIHRYADSIPKLWRDIVGDDPNGDGYFAQYLAGCIDWENISQNRTETTTAINPIGTPNAVAPS